MRFAARTEAAAARPRAVKRVFGDATLLVATHTQRIFMKCMLQCGRTLSYTSPSRASDTCYSSGKRTTAASLRCVVSTPKSIIGHWRLPPSLSPLLRR